MTATAPSVSVATVAGVEVPTEPEGALALPGGGVVRRVPWPAETTSVDLIVPRAQLLDWWERLRGAGAVAAECAVLTLLAAAWT